MSKMGIGSFFGGFADGYERGSKIVRERAKEKREEEEFGLRKQTLALELAARKRQEAFDLDLQNSLAPLIKDFYGSQEPAPQPVQPVQETPRSAVTVMPVPMTNDVEVKPIGPVSGIAREPRETFPPEMETDLKVAEPSVSPAIPQAVVAAPAAQPAQPTQQRRRPNLRELTERFADTSLMVGFKHGKVTLAQLNEARELGRKMDKEGVTEAVETWLTTGDKEKTAEVFNSTGKFKFDPKTMDIQTVNDPNGVLPANVIVTQMGKDGKPQVIFDYANTRLSAISDDAYSQMVQTGRRDILKEKGDTFRTAMTNQTTLDAARIKEGGGTNPEVAALQRKMDNEFKAIFQAAGYSLNPREETRLRAEVGMLARELIEKEQNNMETAYWRATNAVFKKNGINIDTSKLR
jgi:hypothetical protein